MNKDKPYLCADLNAKSYNEMTLKKEIDELDNPYIKFLFKHQHLFFKVIKEMEWNMNGGRTPIYIFTFLHKISEHCIFLNIVVESVDVNKATLIFTTPFRAMRFQYNAMINSIIDYFTNKLPNKRSRLIISKGIASNKPQFSLVLSRTYHIKTDWFLDLKKKLFLEWPNTYGILQDIMVDGQKIPKEYLDGAEIIK